jgi:hypothetical protein
MKNKETCLVVPETNGKNIVGKSPSRNLVIGIGLKSFRGIQIQNFEAISIDTKHKLWKEESTQEVPYVFGKQIPFGRFL